MKQFKLFFACALMSLLSLGQVWATEESVDVTPANALNDGGVDPITIACAKGDGTSNPAISSGQLRLYQASSGKTTGNTITFSSTYAITKIEFTFANSMTADNGSFSDGTYDSGTTTWTGSTNSLTLTVTGTTSGTRIYITAMKVYYETGGGTPTCANPTFSPAAGSYEGTQNVSISSTAGATIYYTTDDSDPTTSGTRQTYSSPIAVSADMTIKAYAVKAEYDDSEVASAAYTITEGPDVTIAFEGNSDWNIPAGSGNKTVDEGTYTDGTYTIKIAGSTGAGYYINGYLLLGKTGAYVELPEFSNPIEKIVVVGTSGGSTGVKFNIYDGTTAVSTEVTGCKNVSQEFTIASPAANKAYKVQVTSNANLQISAIKIYLGTAAAVATPVISGEDNFVTSTEVSMTCSTAGAAIYYTTTESAKATPATSGDWAAYNDADKPSFSATTTVWAAAKKDDDWSSVAEKTFTKAAPLTTTQAVYDKAVAVGSTATAVGITFNNWVVSGISLDNKSVYITDGTKGFVIYDNTGTSHGFAVNDKLSGTVSCQVKLFSKFAEVLGVTSSSTGLTVTHDGVVIPVATAIADLGAVNTGAPIILNSVQFDGTVLSDGANSITPYTTFYADAVTSLESGKYYNITGLYVHYNTTKEVAPRSAADIEELTLADPELSYSPASETIEVGDSWSAPTFNNEHGLTVSFSGDNDAVATVNTTTGEIALAGGTGTAVITASFAGNATYAAGNATYTITVNPASVSENVVILAVYDTKYYAMSTNNSSSVFTAIEVEYDGSQVTVNSAEDKAAIQWTKKTSGDNTTFQNSADKYMKSADGTSMSLQDAVCNWVWDATGEYYKIDGTTRTFFYQNGTGFKNFAVSNFNKSGYSGKAEVIVIDPANIIISSKVSAELAYDPATLTITQGDAWSAPTLGYVVGFDGLAAITYASDNEAVATVTDAGVISLAGGTGTATITATFAGNANYLAGNATYAITVNAPAATPTGTTYTKVTSTAEITDGEYLIVYEGDATHDAMAFNGSLDNVDQALKAIAVTIVGDEIAGNTDLDAATFTIDVAAGTLQSASGYYIGRTVNSNGMEQDNVNTFTNTFAITDGAAVITGVGGCTLRYNYASDQLRFRYYKSGQQDIQLYKKVVPVVTPETVRTGLEINRYYTVCLPKKITSVTGGTFWTLTYKDAEPATMVYIEEATPPFAAGKPYIFQATATSLQVVYEGDATDVAGTNGALVGTLADLDAAALAAKEGTIYLLIQNALRPNYNNYLSANRAYIRYDLLTVGTPVPAPGKRVRTMPLQGQTITGIDELNTSETPAKLMINGQLFILRGEKMYDAQGRLVK